MEGIKGQIIAENFFNLLDLFCENHSVRDLSMMEIFFLTSISTDEMNTPQDEMNGPNECIAKSSAKKPLSFF